MSDFKRTDRIAEMIQRKLAELIQKEIKDPRLPGFITISAVKVSKDLSYAKVYFTVFNGDPEETSVILNSAKSFFASLFNSKKLGRRPRNVGCNGINCPMPFVCHAQWE